MKTASLLTHLDPHTPTMPASRRTAMPSITMLGLPIHCVTAEVALAHIFSTLAEGIGGWMFNPNIDVLQRWVRNETFRMLTADVTLCVADGMPLVWASRLMGTPLPERICGVDFVRRLLAEATVHRRSVFLLGGAPGAADAAIAATRAAHPEIRIAGTYCPPFGFENDPSEWSNISEALFDAQPDIVLVGLGSPKQDLVIDRLRPLLPNAWWLSVGATFSFLGGKLSRAPRWMQHSGLEWLHRLVCEPKRLARRYLVDDVPFAIWLFWRAARGMAAQASSSSCFASLPAAASRMESL